MTIERFVPEDITSPGNRRDIIVGVGQNAVGTQVFGRPLKISETFARALGRGDVLTCKFDRDRDLHLIVCHATRFGGWDGADEAIRFGLDRLYFLDRSVSRRQYSIVQIGAGATGQRGGADVASIILAMTTSRLPLYLYARSSDENGITEVVDTQPLVPYQAIHRDSGIYKMSM